MKKCGKPLTKRQNSRALIYETANGESVRLKTNMGRVLMSKTDSPDTDAKQNLEETKWILLVIPEVRNALGPLVAYLLPAEMVVETFRNSHAKWRSCPDTSTQGANMTWVLHFDEIRLGKPDKNELYGYAERWKIYRLNTLS